MHLDADLSSSFRELIGMLMHLERISKFRDRCSNIKSDSALHKYDCVSTWSGE